MVVGAANKKKSVTPVSLKDNNKSGGPPKKKEASKEALAIHRKWQAEAVKLGGPEAKIVVSKGAAKKLIFDMMYDAFRPMNITEIYQVGFPVLFGAVMILFGTWSLGLVAHALSNALYSSFINFIEIEGDCSQSHSSSLSR